MLSYITNVINIVKVQNIQISNMLKNIASYGTNITQFSEKITFF